jgi:hypothetical protein
MSLLTYWLLLFKMMQYPPTGERDAPEQTTKV